MEVVGIFIGILIGILIGLNIIPLVVKKNYPTFRKSMRIVLIISIVVLVLELVASSMNLKIKGAYTIKIIAGISLISSVLYLALQKTSKSKIIANLILIPISKIEPIIINNQTIEIMIHHNGGRDSENPYHYKIENNNEW